MIIYWLTNVCVILVMGWCIMPIWMHTEVADDLYENGIITSYSSSVKLKRSAGVIGLTVWRGLKAVQSLLYEARMITRQNNARYFEKSGGTFRALSDFKSVQPHEVRSMPLLKGIETTVGRVGDRLLILKYGKSTETTLEIRKIEKVTKQGEHSWHTPKLTEKITYRD